MIVFMKILESIQIIIRCKSNSISEYFFPSFVCLYFVVCPAPFNVFVCLYLIVNFFNGSNFH